MRKSAGASRCAPTHNYRARPRTSLWQSADPILGTYLEGERGRGGIYNSANLGLYSYTHLNPVRYQDPDGESIFSVADWVDFGKDVGGLLVDEIVYVAAVAVGDDAVAQLAVQGMVEKRGDAAASTIGVVSPVPRTGAAIKAAKAMRTTRRGPDPCSFVAGTPVMTQDGLKPIEAIREGDIVLARDEETGEQVWREVIGTLSKMHETVLVLDFEAEDGEQTQVITTDDHPFYVRGQGWTEAGKIKEGVLLETADGFVRLTGSTSVAKRQLAYDLTVDSAHTFFVGEAQVWVHNCRIAPKAKPVNLPSWKKINIDMEHVASGHMKGGSRVSSRKDVFPENMTGAQVEKTIRQAYRHGKRIKTQGDRVLVRGNNVEMWVNTKSKTIETAYPLNK